MSEEVKAPAPAPKPKQYLLLADELHMAMLGKLMPGLMFVQVEGLAIQNNDSYMMLVNPIAKPQPVAAVKAEEPRVD